MESEVVSISCLVDTRRERFLSCGDQPRIKREYCDQVPCRIVSHSKPLTITLDLYVGRSSCIA